MPDYCILIYQDYFSLKTDLFISICQTYEGKVIADKKDRSKVVTILKEIG